MVNGLIGQKIGMTRVFDDSGNHVPVTVLKAGPCVVLQVKTEETDGYRAAQVGLVDETVKEKRHTKAMLGHLAAAGTNAVRVIREFEIEGDEEVSPGDQLTVEQFAEIGKVDGKLHARGNGRCGNLVSGCRAADHAGGARNRRLGRRDRGSPRGFDPLGWHNWSGRRR